jgi:hypothetical protein
VIFALLPISSPLLVWSVLFDVENVCLIQRLIQLHKPVAQNTFASIQIICCMPSEGVRRGTPDFGWKNYYVTLFALNFIKINRILHNGFSCIARKAYETYFLLPYILTIFQAFYFVPCLATYWTCFNLSFRFPNEMEICIVVSAIFLFSTKIL